MALPPRDQRHQYLRFDGLKYSEGDIADFEEEVHGIRESLAEQREVMDAMARDFSRFTLWEASGKSQLLDVSGATYTRYSETHVPYQRRGVRQRIGKANTLAAPLDEDQADPLSLSLTFFYFYLCLNHNLFSVGQFCDADLEVAFGKSTCFVRDLQGNDLLTGNRGSDLYKISLLETSSPTLICFMEKASLTQAWLLHQRLSHLNFDTINLLSKKDIGNGLPKLKYVKDQLCSYCEWGKAKISTFKKKTVPSSKGRLNLLHMNLCSPMRIESINGKKYILVIVDDYSRYTWTHFLRSKDETPEVLKYFLKMIQRNLQAQAEAIETACYTQKRSLIIPGHEKTPYHIINERKPTLKHLYIFHCTFYLVRDGKNVDKIKEKGDPCIFMGYSTTSKGYRVYNKRTRLIAESIYINFDEIKELSLVSDYDNSGPTPQLQKTSDHNFLELGIQDHNNEPSSLKLDLNVSPPAKKIDSSQQELDFLFSPLFEEYFIEGNQNHLLEQVRRNPSMPVQTRKQLSTDPEMCMFALAVSSAEPTNIEEAMADHAWIEAMQEELH
ncbi:retrovirus-related pol polyprotein from transposon TNT 1-94 [Tanacetum coccineum]